MKRLYSSFDLAAVYHAKNVLEAEGIRVIVRNEILSSAMGELPPAECQAELWLVRDADAERATRVLKYDIWTAGAPWRCRACGEALEPQFTQCWRCNVYKEKP